MAENNEDLRPKPPAKLAPQGIRTFTVKRQSDSTGVSGTGIVIEGTMHATGQAVVHWLYPPPRGSFAIFDSFEDFVKVHVAPHPSNKTIITFDDGEQKIYPPPVIQEQEQLEEGDDEQLRLPFENKE